MVQVTEMDLMMVKSLASLTEEVKAPKMEADSADLKEHLMAKSLASLMEAMRAPKMEEDLVQMMVCPRGP